MSTYEDFLLNELIGTAGLDEDQQLEILLRMESMKQSAEADVAVTA